jgi:hypothetical protein
MTTRRWQWLFIVPAVAAYVFSLFLPAAEFIGPITGAAIWLSFPSGLGQILVGKQSLDWSIIWVVILWSPNALFPAAVILLALRRHRLALGAASLAFASTWFWLMAFPLLRIGYFLWSGSMLLLAFGGGWLACFHDQGRRWITGPTLPPSIMDPAAAAWFNQAQKEAVRLHGSLFRPFPKG